MKLSRNITNKINIVLDNLIPPFLRDAKWFMGALLKVALGQKSHYYLTFKESLDILKPQALKKYYECTADVNQRKTDLNKECIAKIMAELEFYDSKATVLDIACGHGYLTEMMAQTGKKVTGIDFLLPTDISSRKASYIEADIKNIPCEDQFFDIVICAHTLEHCMPADLQIAISELRRVCKKKLMIVVPCQREYRYTFDLHLNFFPYCMSFQRVMNNNSAVCSKVGGDIFYIENIE